MGETGEWQCFSFPEVGVRSSVKGHTPRTMRINTMSLAQHKARNFTCFPRTAYPRIGEMPKEKAMATLFQPLVLRLYFQES